MHTKWLGHHLVCTMCTISRLRFAGAGGVIESLGVEHQALQGILGEESIGDCQDSYSLQSIHEPAEEVPEQQLAYALRQTT